MSALFITPKKWPGRFCQAIFIYPDILRNLVTKEMIPTDQPAPHFLIAISHIRYYDVCTK